MLKILITGSNGLLGQALAAHFERIKDVRLLLTGLGACRYNGISEYLSLDVTLKENILSIVNSFMPDIIINNAGVSSVDQCEVDKDQAYSRNVSPIEYLAKSANEVGALLVQLSSELIFDGSDTIYDELSDPHPLNYYGWTKHMSELKLKALCRNYAIVRCSHVYGFNQNVARNNLPLWVYQSVKSGKDISVVGDQWRTPVYIYDVVDIVSKICNQRLTGVFNVAGRDYLSLFEAAVLTAKIFDLDQNKITKVKSADINLVGNRPKHLRISTAKITELFEYNPKTFEGGVLEMKYQIESKQLFKKLSDLNLDK